jgi:AcrR family transcriptional regulator
MARPREFDRDAALRRAMEVFWRNGYAATSTEELLTAMKIGRQSLYDTFGDKRRLYVEALVTYQQASISENIDRLRSAASAIGGIEALLLGLINSGKAARQMGCMGVNSISEFGASDPELAELRAKAGGLQHRAVLERLREGQAKGEIESGTDIEGAAGFIEMAMLGIRVAAKAGESPRSLRKTVDFVVAALRVKN